MKSDTRQSLPVLAYHGSDKRFTKFEHTYCWGFHFGNVEVARHVASSSGGFVRGFHLSFRNLVRLPDLCEWLYDDVVAALRQTKVIDRKTVGLWQNSGHMVDLAHELAVRGFDGVVYRNDYEGSASDSFIAFSNQQIHPVTPWQRWDKA